MELKNIDTSTLEWMFVAHVYAALAQSGPAPVNVYHIADLFLGHHSDVMLDAHDEIVGKYYDQLPGMSRDAHTVDVVTLLFQELEARRARA